MNPKVIDTFITDLGANGLPYSVPIHPNLVHLTIGLFIIAITFDTLGAMFGFQKPVFKFFAIPATRSNFFDVGWYNLLAASIITIFTVAAGFYEMMLANPVTDVKSAWGLGAMDTMLWHGVGGVFIFAFMIGMTIWRGFQRFLWRRERTIQVQWAYLGVGFFMLFLLFLHGTLGAQIAAEFGVHNTADQLLESGHESQLLMSEVNYPKEYKSKL
ncbi:MAG: DUF2231 domain-containing protein [cyanobacterium endosymbiont of Rhopalodia musculus]|uniref:DUF2231 domain-containing protein n=1 Tax=cyanobacterium endosymbiont of Epithemia clementina EcSB TaxID=3034674 RepID=UPI00247FF2F3|nr:DUF2231 domain-containing protein [cyanobacterium endosymbiont of Epithemia clementina EcSB]WGT66803.1 DUF2231 domain-containing protein [cyanobacterium endosymbiont of Epithemia clementina EcSB]